MKHLKRNNMTPKETAKELVKQYLAIQDNISWTEDKEVIKYLEEWHESNVEAEKYWLMLAQKSALICAEQNLSTLVATHRNITLKTIDDKVEYDKHVKHWHGVVKELKLIISE